MDVNLNLLELQKTCRSDDMGLGIGTETALKLACLQFLVNRLHSSRRCENETVDSWSPSKYVTSGSE